MTATKMETRKPRAGHGRSEAGRVVSACVSDSLHLQNRWKWTVQDFQRTSDLGAFGVGSFNDYKRTRPITAVLVVEVSDTTLKMDQTGKAASHARAGIPEYWIVNLNERVLEVHRLPERMPDQALHLRRGLAAVAHGRG